MCAWHNKIEQRPHNGEWKRESESFILFLPWRALNLTSIAHSAATLLVSSVLISAHAIVAVVKLTISMDNRKTG